MSVSPSQKVTAAADSMAQSIKSERVLSKQRYRSPSKSSGDILPSCHSTHVRNNADGVNASNIPKMIACSVLIVVTRAEPTCYRILEFWKSTVRMNELRQEHFLCEISACPTSIPAKKLFAPTLLLCRSCRSKTMAS